MIHKRIKLFEDKEVFLSTYIHDDIGTYGTENGRGAIIVLPGGAFAFLSQWNAPEISAALGVEPDADVVADGLSILRNVVQDSEADIIEWLESGCLLFSSSTIF